ncbi:MAG: acyltransferase [Candidatus Eisenbacteria bacterium]
MKTYKIYPNVRIGEGAIIGDYVIIGHPLRGKEPGEVETIIGNGAVIRSHSVIYAGNVIGDDFQCGHQVFMREANTIGNNVSIGTQCGVEHHVEIGDNVRIQGQTGIAEYSFLEEGCWLGPQVITTNTFHPLCPKVKECLLGPTIKKRAIIGASVTLYPRVVVGERALVGAGCVVMKDVPPNAVLMSRPSKVVGSIFELGCPFELIDRPYREDD